MLHGYVRLVSKTQRRYKHDWLEHVERLEEARVPKQALWYRLKGRKDPGRPRRRWNSQKPEQANGLILKLEKIVSKTQCKGRKPYKIGV
jgi:hypothetical protein